MNLFDLIVVIVLQGYELPQFTLTLSIHSRGLLNFLRRVLVVMAAYKYLSHFLKVTWIQPVIS